MSIQDQIVKLMQRKTGVTLSEVVDKGINPNTARRVLGGMKSKVISRRCKITGKWAAAYTKEA